MSGTVSSLTTLRLRMQWKHCGAKAGKQEGKQFVLNPKFSFFSGYLFCQHNPRRSKVRFAPTSFYTYGKKDVIRPLPCSSLPNRNRWRWVAVWVPKCAWVSFLSTLPKLSPDAFRVPGSAFSFALPGCDFIFAALREEGGAELLVALFGRFWYSFDGNLRLGVAVETVKQCRTLRRKTT